MLRNGIYKCKQTTILGSYGAKSEKIKNIRKQYDAFLEEDKKRKERNEYILEKLDKMRCCDSLVPFRTKVQFVNDSNYHILASNRLSHYAEVKNDGQETGPQMKVSPLDMRVKSFDETMLLTEISKKYILIPKLHSDVSTLIAKPLTKIFADSDWKSKYEILDQLKQEEKEEPTTMNQDILKESNSQKFFELNEESHILNPINKMKHEEPERDTNISENHENKKGNAKQKCASILATATKNNNTAFIGSLIDKSNAQFTSSPSQSGAIGEEIPASFESFTKDFPPDTAAISQNNADISKGNINLVQEQNYTCFKTNPTSQEQISTEVMNSVTVDIPLQDSSQTQLPNINDSISSPEYHIDTGDSNDYKQETNPTNKEQKPNINITETPIVHTVDPSQLDSQDNQQKTNEYDGSYGFPAGYNLASTEVNYQYDNNEQEYYNLPSAHQEYRYNNSQDYSNNDSSEYPTLENLYAQQHENTEQKVNETFYAEPEVALEDPASAVGDYINTIKVPANEEIPDGKDYDHEVADEAGDQAETLTFKEGIEDFEAEQTEFFGQNDGVHFPDTFAADVVIGGDAQENLNKPEEEYNAIYEEQITQDPLDNNDYDATLQQYDQSYEAQYTSIYDDGETALNEEEISYEPLEVQQLEYEPENMLDIEEQLDTEQGYVLDEVIMSEQNAQEDADPVEQPIAQVTANSVEQPTVQVTESKPIAPN